MKAHRHTYSRAFTLLELLLVITLIAILASLAATQIIKAIDDGNRVKVLSVAMELKNGIDSYHVEYNRFPIDSGVAGAHGEDAPEVLTDGSNSLVEALTGVPPAAGGAQDLNPKRVQFAQFPPAKNDRHGLVGSVRPYKLNDMYGKPYHVLLDTNGDNQVKNPDTSNTDPKISLNKPANLATKVAVYSSGKDQIPLTADDVTTWRSK